jgi:hypothetical protein
MNSYRTRAPDWGFDLGGHHIHRCLHRSIAALHCCTKYESSSELQAPPTAATTQHRDLAGNQQQRIRKLENSANVWRKYLGSWLTNLIRYSSPILAVIDTGYLQSAAFQNLEAPQCKGLVTSPTEQMTQPCPTTALHPLSGLKQSLFPLSAHTPSLPIAKMLNNVARLAVRRYVLLFCACCCFVLFCVAALTARHCLHWLLLWLCCL